MPVTINGNGTISGLTQVSASAQPSCLLGNLVNEVMTSADNDDPIEFHNIVTNVGMTINSAKSRITVPQNGTYLVTACVSGDKLTTDPIDANDGIFFILLKNGSTFSNDTDTFPFDVFGATAGQEFSFVFSIPVPLVTDDYLEVALNNINNSSGEVKNGYFSVTRLH